MLAVLRALTLSFEFSRRLSSNTEYSREMPMFCSMSLMLMDFFPSSSPLASFSACSERVDRSVPQN